MSRSKQENYLDGLLSSVNADRSPEELEMMSLRSQLNRMKNANENEFDLAATYDEDRFVREFERELENDNYEQYIEEFEKEIDGQYGGSDSGKGRTEASPAEIQPSEEESEGLFVNTLDDDSDVPGMSTELEKSGNNRGKEETFTMPDLTDDMFAGLETKEEENSMADSSVNQTNEEETTRPIEESDLSEFSEIVGEVNGTTVEQELPRTEDGEVDLSGNSGMDLMDILDGDDGLSELGEILSGEGELGGEDAIGDFAEQEMKEQEKAQRGEEEEEEGKKGRRRRKRKEKKAKKQKTGEEGEKTGLFAKIARFFFGADEEEKEEDIIVGLNGGSNASELSDENAKILSEMDKEGKKKKKEKKPKKEKPKKEKPKKEKPKKEKPKKEKPKKEKPKDNTPPLPKVPVILIFVMVTSLVVFVLLGTNVGNYTLKMKNAKGYFRMKDYTTALEQLRGATVNEKDEKFYHQLETLSAVSSKLKNYDIFSKSKNEQMAFDSIVCAAGRYTVNVENSKKYECEKELNALKDQIVQILKKDYNMKFEEAIEIYSAGDRLDYTNKLLGKLKEMGRTE